MYPSFFFMKRWIHLILEERYNICSYKWSQCWCKYDPVESYIVVHPCTETKYLRFFIILDECMSHRRYKVAFRIIMIIVSILSYEIPSSYEIFEEKYLLWSIEGTLYFFRFHMSFMEFSSEYISKIWWMEKCIDFTRRVHDDLKL